jgi:hypothetical protein
MTISDFVGHPFGKSDKFIYKGVAYCLSGVDFEEFLLELYDPNGREIVRFWVRCENAELVK